MTDWHHLDLADFLLIAEAVLDLPAEQVLAASRIDLAESALHAPTAESGGVEFYTDLATKTPVLAWRLIRNHPLPDGNKRVGYLCALEFVARDGGTWSYPADDPDGDVTVATIEGVAAGEVSESELAGWVDVRLGEQS